jgi:hypothetical protein
MYSDSKAVSKKQQVNFRIDTDLLEALKQQAEVEGISYTDLIQRFCKQCLNSDTIHNAIQPDFLKEQLKAELREEIIGEVKGILSSYQKEISKKIDSLVDECNSLRQYQTK